MFSIGVILYVMLSGVEPFNGKTMSKKMERNRRGEFSFPEDKFEKVTHEAKDLLLGLLSTIPAERLSPS
jgi:serine/threonine protein kinase